MLTNMWWEIIIVVRMGYSGYKTANSSRSYLEDDFRLQIIDMLLILYVAMAPFVCFCVVICVKHYNFEEKLPSANLVYEGLWHIFTTKLPNLPFFGAN